MRSQAVVEREDTYGETIKFLPAQDISKKTGTVVILCILALSAVLMFTKLGDMPFHHDEGIHAVFSRAWKGYWQRAA